MPHYKDGVTEAQVGDIVIGRSRGVPHPILGIVVAVRDRGTCSLDVARRAVLNTVRHNPPAGKSTPVRRACIVVECGRSGDFVKVGDRRDASFSATPRRRAPQSPAGGLRG